jgi:hypothetical protein
MWWELNVYPLLFQVKSMSTLLHIDDFSQFVLQESLSLSSQIKFLKLVRTYKERGKVPRDKQPLKSNVRNLGRAPSSTSGNSTSLEQAHIQKCQRCALPRYISVTYKYRRK